ncbi:hypothetical protein [Amycolatopsis sp. FDAARGOS 1241]|uniref:hypothetical protein n=1 Tax=Amycolatopsis sp. FDAARGOS 1241 TaxID=2778070 RepID=UPI0019508089|nr:hypothetical protein [Amycolatopsis sp. FDAARGOS 1241]QRP50134.1 hypothetical protein I6J71_21960 [Amycolatopsis sp. FDAARGOS 1241]
MSTVTRLPSNRGDTAEVGAGVLIAVGIVIVFFTWWSWWTVAGLALLAAGGLTLALGSAGLGHRRGRSGPETP